jgi:hypothetical protein
MMTDKVRDAAMMDGHSARRAVRRRLREQKRRVQRGSAGLLAVVAQEEVLVVDDRTRIRPAEVVERKLTRMLQEASVAVSHLQMRGLLKAR